MRSMRAGAVAALLALGVLAQPAARAAEGICTPGAPPQELCAGTVIFAGPAAKTTNYAPPVAVANPALPVSFVTVEVLEAHNVVSFDTTLDATRRAKRFWCDTPLFPAGTPCPLFWSPTITAGSTRVHGIDDLAPGTYEFYCEPHRTTMIAELIVV